MHCPECDSLDIARSHRANFQEHFLSWLRIWPLRCQNCNGRWLVFSWYDPKRDLG
jgi:hypothetical protein